jgi:hypothetical protein
MVYAKTFQHYLSGFPKCIWLLKQTVLFIARFACVNASRGSYLLDHLDLEGRCIFIDIVSGSCIGVDARLAKDVAREWHDRIRVPKSCFCQLVLNLCEVSLVRRSLAVLEV